MMWDALVLSQGSSTAHMVVLECTTVITLWMLEQDAQVHMCCLHAYVFYIALSNCKISTSLFLIMPLHNASDNPIKAAGITFL